MSRVVAPDGRAFETNRPFRYAVLVGPCTKEKFLERTAQVARESEELRARIRGAAERGVLRRAGVEGFGMSVWLEGWEEFGVPDPGGDTVLAYLYEPGEVETKEEPEEVTFLELLRNYAGAEVVRETNRIALVSAAARRVEGGSVLELGVWHVAKWCRDVASATRAVRTFEDERGPWGCEVVVRSCEEGSK